MTSAELMIGLGIGGLLIDLGLRRGSFREFVERIRNIHLSNRDWMHESPLAYSTATKPEAPVWLAIAGAALIALTVAGFIAG